jgi:hypothetical protein
VVDKIVLDTSGVKPSYLGAPETRNFKRDFSRNGATAQSLPDYK